jgi:hypothetical protein
MIAKALEKAKKQLYSVALLATMGRKTCTNLSNRLKVSHDKIQRYLSKGFDLIYQANLLTIAKQCFQQEPIYLVLDDTRINKDYSKKIEGVTEGRDGSSGKTTKGLQIVTSMLTNLKVNIPIQIEALLNKVICPENHLTKSEVAWNIIEAITSIFNISMLLADAHYATKYLLPKLIKCKVPFLMKMPRNRIVTIGSVQGQLQRIFRLRRNERSRRIQATFHGLTLWFYIIKVDSAKTIYFVSSEKLDPKQIAQIYKIRWRIETLHRTAKQSLGLQDCQARSLNKQMAHSYAVMLAYATAEIIRFQKKLDSPEQAIRLFRIVKLDYYHDPHAPLDQNFDLHA